jgi:sugar lactone lactonase YvrE
VQKFDPDFNFISEWPVTGWESTNITNKPFIAIDSQDRVYISDPENYRIIVYSNGGDILGVFGQFGQDVESFKLPLGLAIGEDDIVYVLDSGNNRVMKFAYEGQPPVDPQQ